MTDPTQIYQDRFSGTARLYGQQALEWLRDSHVAVVGLGGVGSWVAESLARTGVGELTLIDMDDICVSNTNRQIHALDGHYGQLKTDALAERVKAINPSIQVHTVADFLTRDNVAELISKEMDFVVDAIDSFRPKAALIAFAVRNKIPVITAGSAGGQTDPLQVTRSDLTKTLNDPLMKKVRNWLRREYGFSKNSKRKFNVDCVYSTEPLKYPKPDGTICQQKSVMAEGGKLNCASGFGASTMVTATFGFAISARVVEKLISKKARLHAEK